MKRGKGKIQNTFCDKEMTVEDIESTVGTKVQ